MNLSLPRGLLFMTLAVAAIPAWAETPEEWIQLGARVHGSFGAWKLCSDATATISPSNSS